MNAANQALSVAQFRYDNLAEEDFNSAPIVDQFLDSSEGSNWIHGQAIDLVHGRDSDYVTQTQFRKRISEHLASLEWNDDQDSAQVDLIIMACTGANGAYTVVKRLIGKDGLEGLAKELLVSSGAIELHLTL